MLFHPRRYNVMLEKILNKEKNFIYSYIRGISYNKRLSGSITDIRIGNYIR